MWIMAYFLPGQLCQGLSPRQIHNLTFEWRGFERCNVWYTMRHLRFSFWIANAKISSHQIWETTKDPIFSLLYPAEHIVLIPEAKDNDKIALFKNTYGIKLLHPYIGTKCHKRINLLDAFLFPEMLSSIRIPSTFSNKLVSTKEPWGHCLNVTRWISSFCEIWRSISKWLLVILQHKLLVSNTWSSISRSKSKKHSSSSLYHLRSLFL